MKILHIGDVHLGNRQYRSDIRYEDFFDTFEEAIDYAIHSDVDAVIQTGDLFDSSNPSIETISRTLDILSKLSRNKIDFYAIVGNHERKREDQWLDVINRVGNASRLNKNPTIVTSNNQSVALYGIDAVRKPQWNSTDFTLTPPSQNVDISIVCMHELVSPPITGDATTGMSTYNSERILERFDLSVDVLALGDFHVPIEGNIGSTYLYYGGATERTNKNQGKTVISELQIQDGEVNREVINLTRSRPFVETELRFKTGDGINFVEENLSKFDFSPNGKKDSVGVVELYGEDTGVTVTDIESILKREGARVTHVIDKRESIVDAAVNNVTEDPSDSIEGEIDEKIAEHDFSDVTREIEEVIRDEDTPKHTIEDTVKNILKEGDNNED